jgi:hypothetical protein
MSGPKIASSSTASQMRAIARNAHISGRRSCDAHSRFFSTTRDGSCEMVVISDLLSPSTIASAVSDDIGSGPDHGYVDPRRSSL